MSVVLACDISTEGRRGESIKIGFNIRAYRSPGQGGENMDAQSGDRTAPKNKLRAGNRLARDTSGAAAVEFAFVGPLIVVMLLGIMSYGGYFWLAHSVQQLANDGARAAVAGLSATERQQLARSTVSAEIADYAFLTATGLVTTVTTDTTSMTVSLAYNASQTPFFALGSLVPMPSSTITRTATIKLAGY
jgi:Flp pilus assembly protein TadG